MIALLVFACTIAETQGPDELAKAGLAASHIARETSPKDAIVFLGAVPPKDKVYPQAARLLEAVEKSSTNGPWPELRGRLEEKLDVLLLE